MGSLRHAKRLALGMAHGNAQIGAFVFPQPAVGQANQTPQITGSPSALRFFRSQYQAIQMQIS
jgi:hypothetical protein